MGVKVAKVIDPIRGTGETLSGMRVLHGPTGAAGQPATLAAALDKIEGYSARSLQIASSKMAYSSDFYYPLTSNSIESNQALLRSVINDFDLFHLHSRTFFHDPSKMAFPTGLDLLLLKAAGKGVVVHFRGSEVRLQSVFKGKAVSFCR